MVLQDISWGLYEQLSKELRESPATRLAYDGGQLQIKVVSAAHDNPNRTLASIVEIVAEELGIDACHLGSTTFRRADLLKGFEPDSSYYFRNADLVRDKEEIILPSDPPPELVIEVDITSRSLDRFPIFAAIGVGEVWRYSQGTVTMYRLADGQYAETERSVALPAVTAALLTEFVASYRKTKCPVWAAELRARVRAA